eukprot:g12526.t1
MKTDIIQTSDERRSRRSRSASVVRKFSPRTQANDYARLRNLATKQHSHRAERNWALGEILAWGGAEAGAWGGEDGDVHVHLENERRKFMRRMKALLEDVGQGVQGEGEHPRATGEEAATATGEERSRKTLAELELILGAEQLAETADLTGAASRVYDGMKRVFGEMHTSVPMLTPADRVSRGSRRDNFLEQVRAALDHGNMVKSKTPNSGTESAAHRRAVVFFRDMERAIRAFVAPGAATTDAGTKAFFDSMVETLDHGRMKVVDGGKADAEATAKVGGTEAFFDSMVKTLNDAGSAGAGPTAGRSARPPKSGKIGRATPTSSGAKKPANQRSKSSKARSSPSPSSARRETQTSAEKPAAQPVKKKASASSAHQEDKDSSPKLFFPEPHRMKPALIGHQSSDRAGGGAPAEDEHKNKSTNVFKSQLFTYQEDRLRQQLQGPGAARGVVNIIKSDEKTMAPCMRQVAPKHEPRSLLTNRAKHKHATGRAVPRSCLLDFAHNEFESRKLEKVTETAWETRRIDGGSGLTIGRSWQPMVRSEAHERLWAAETACLQGRRWWGTDYGTEAAGTISGRRVARDIWDMTTGAQVLCLRSDSSEVAVADLPGDRSGSGSPAASLKGTMGNKRKKKKSAAPKPTGKAKAKRAVKAKAAAASSSLG